MRKDRSNLRDHTVPRRSDLSHTVLAWQVSPVVAALSLDWLQTAAAASGPATIVLEQGVELPLARAASVQILAAELAQLLVCDALPLHVLSGAPSVGLHIVSGCALAGRFQRLLE